MTITDNDNTKGLNASWEVKPYFNVTSLISAKDDTLSLKVKANHSSLEWSADTPPKYHSFVQSPIMS